MAFVQTILKIFDKFASRGTANLLQYVLFILIVLIPFSVRHVFDSTWNFETGAYSDFTSLSIYLSDIVLILLIFSFCLAILYKKMEVSTSIPKVWIYTAIAAVTWLIFELFIQRNETLPLQAYFSVRIMLLIALAVIVSHIHVSREKLAWVFTILSGIQSLIAIFQFYAQKSIGLYLLGESHLGADTLGVAKIVSHGTKLIRSYGTFPHSNLLSAFLVVGIVFNLYLLIKRYQIPRGEIISRGTFAKKPVFLYIFFLLNTFGLFLTFSRAGILAFGIGLGVLIGYLLINKRIFKVFNIIIPIIIALIVSMGILFPYLTTRTTISDSATKERRFYNEIGTKMIKTEPLIGLGAGTSVLHMKQFSNKVLEPWEIQPIHNYYLISFAEWGIGGIFLIILIIYPLFALFKGKINVWQLTLAAIGLSFLTLFLFDHYFYTIWPTQLLLWLIVGLVLRESCMWNKQCSKTTYDTTSHS